MNGGMGSRGRAAIAVLTAVTVLILCCHRGGKSCKPDSCILADIVGTWQWTLTTGGFAGIRKTPDSSGESWTLRFREVGTYEQERSGQPPEQGRYAVETREDADHLQHPALVIAGCPDRLIDRPDDGTLILRDNVIDGYEHTFLRAAERR